MKKNQLKKVDLTLVGKFNKMISKGIFALEVAFDALALAARGLRDAMFVIASRSAEMADREESDSKTFKRVDDKIDSALRR